MSTTPPPKQYIGNVKVSDAVLVCDITTDNYGTGACLDKTLSNLVSESPVVQNILDSNYNTGVNYENTYGVNGRWASDAVSIQ